MSEHLDWFDNLDVDELVSHPGQNNPRPPSNPVGQIQVRGQWEFAERLRSMPPVLQDELSDTLGRIARDVVRRQLESDRHRYRLTIPVA